MLLYQTHALIHLSNIKENIFNIRRHVGKNCKILISVKANGYGHGAVEISRMAERVGVDWLGVATVPEGVELRKSGIMLPILKLSPAFQCEMKAAIENDITLTICDKQNVEELEVQAKILGIKVKVHLKIDTGMGRIGLNPMHIEEFFHWFRNNCSNVKIEGIFSHFAASDNPKDNRFTFNQLEMFNKIVIRAQEIYKQTFNFVHIANSGGVLAHKNSWCTMVRPGIMIYGFKPDENCPNTLELKPGLSLYSKVSFMKRIRKGTTVGYGRTWRASEDTWIATIPIGYADGFNRLFSNCGRCLINGVSYPIVGRICMDQSTVNLGPDGDSIVKVEDKVTLIGKDGNEEIPVYEWAKKLNTITYEVTCQINNRVKRIYEDY